MDFQLQTLRIHHQTKAKKLGDLKSRFFFLLYSIPIVDIGIKAGILWLFDDRAIDPKIVMNYIGFNLLVFIPLATYVHSTIYDKLSQFHNKLNSGSLWIDRNQFTYIWQVLDEIIEDIPTLKGERIILKYEQTNSISPHVSLQGGAYFIYLPRKLILMARTHKEEFRGIFAHEVGHIIQRDCERNDFLIIFHGLFLKTMNIIIGIFLIGFLFGVGAKFSAFTIYFLMNLIILSQISSQRTKSEYAADLFAASVIGLDQMIQTLKNNLVDHIALLSAHPSRSSRIKYLQSVNRRYQRVLAKM